MRRLALCLGLGISGQAAAQEVSGRVVTAESVPVSGAVVTLLDSAGAPLARALADSGGRFNMRLPRQGTYRFRVLRLGFSPTLDPPFYVDARDLIERTVMMTGQPIRLRAIEVTAEQQCVGSDSGTAGFLAWQQARTALLASQLTRLTRAYTMDIERFVHQRSPDRMAPPRMTRSEMLGTRMRALTPVTPEQLARDGYIARNAGGDRYFAPDEEVLLSDSFAATHCMRLLPRDGADDVVRLGFVPVPGRTVPDIRGVITMDAATAELRRLQFQYVNLAPAEMEGDPGGEIVYRRLPEGSWIVEYWALVLPFREQYVQQQAVPPSVSRNGQANPGRPAVVVTGIGHTTSGGGVTRIRFGDEVVWSATEPPMPHGPIILPPMRW